MEVKVVSLNLRRFSRESKILQIKLFLQQEDPDIVFLQKNEKWIIPKELMLDDHFIEGLMEIVEKIDEEKKEEIESWVRLKDLTKMWARMRMGEIIREENGRKEYLTTIQVDKTMKSRC